MTAGLAPSLWNDVYHVAMTARLPVFVAGIMTVFGLTNAVFALLYWIRPDAIANSAGDFENLFYFSVETITTVGYGELFPQTRYGHIVVSTEVFTGLFFTATMLGLIFARMSHGRGRLVWLRGMVASIVSQVVDTVLFITISFLGERPILGLMAGQMLTKVALSIVLVPWLITGFVALGRRLDRPRRA